LRLLLLTIALLAGVTLPAHAAGPEGNAVACMAEAVYFEARGTGETGALAVANVVQNRAEARDFPGTVCGVVQEGCQFSYRCDGRSDALTHASERARALRVAEAVISGEAPDPTGGALFFHSARANPGWFATRPRIGEIAGNVFYR
jgi:N-acetylmuramoyl-L-alanine amidase